MILKNRKIDIYWLTLKGMYRNYFGFIIKILIFILWQLILINSCLVICFKVELKIESFIKLILFILFILLNLVMYLSTYTIFTFATKQRAVEFGLLRALGMRRKEIFKLIMQESIILPPFTSFISFLIELFIILKLKLVICGLLKISYDFLFFRNLFLIFFGSFLFKIFITATVLFPSALYYSGLDAYNILKQ